MTGSAREVEEVVALDVDGADEDGDTIMDPSVGRRILRKVAGFEYERSKGKYQICEGELL